MRGKTFILTADMRVRSEADNLVQLALNFLKDFFVITLHYFLERCVYLDAEVRKVRKTWYASIFGWVFA